MGGVEGETPGTAVGGRVGREDPQQVEAGPRLVDEDLVGEVTAGQQAPGQSSGRGMATGGKQPPLTRHRRKPGPV